MLRTILSISGRPGLYKLISRGKNALIVESLIDGKRIPSHAQEKAIALQDIAIFTNEGEVPLRDVFTSIFTKENGAKSSVDTKADTKTLRNYLIEVLPNYDQERVYPNDIKKIITWYNLLIGAGFTSFEVIEEEKANEQP